MIYELKKQVLQANLDLVNYGLVILTWGNVSGINRPEGLIVIKPSGVAYRDLTIDNIVVTDMEGQVVEGTLRPSSDLATHIELYKSFPEIGGITHTHSTFATSFAQACKEISCIGTTHADYFCSAVPVTRFLSQEEVNNHYEQNTGKVIVERFSDIDPGDTPAVLVAGHGPFTWGKDAHESMQNSLILEQVAEMTMYSRYINPGIRKLPEYICAKHYQRKHGPDSYYGQNS
jgi:L-ribulose-5-phosphate 4-epimerase